MQMIIDVTGLPWARGYYEMFPFEPSRNAADDMEFTNVKRRYLEKPTLRDVLKVMVDAAAQNEKEIFVVAHGNEKGLVMHIAPTIPFSAEVSVLKWLPIAAEIFDLNDNSANVAPNRGLLNAWARIAALFEAQADETQAQSLTGGFATDWLSQTQGDVAKACSLAQTQIMNLVLKNPKGLVRMMKTTEKGLREIAELTDKVRSASFSRIELRSCNIGSGPGIAALRSFFACDRLMAPEVHTFYVHVNAPDNTAAQMALAARHPGPRWRVFYSDPQSYLLNTPSWVKPGVRPFFDPPDSMRMFVDGKPNFMLRVTRVHTPRYVSEARRLNAGVISTWVTRYIHWKARYTGSGPFWVGGLDAPTPNGQPYTLPQDANYRSLIAVATAFGVER